MSTSASERPRILIVEHDPQIRELLATLLQLEGYAVGAVATLEQAYESVEQDLYALVLTDLFAPPSQPRVNAVQHLARRCFPIPVGLLTGWQVDQVEVARSGCAFLVPKPFDLDVLLQHITKHLPLPLPAEQPQAQRVQEGLTALREQEWAVFHRLLTRDVRCVPPTGSAFVAEAAINGIESLLAYLHLVLSHLPGFQIELGVLIPRDHEVVARFQARWLGQKGQQQLTGALVCRFREDQIAHLEIRWNSQCLRALLALPPQPAN